MHRIAARPTLSSLLAEYLQTILVIAGHGTAQNPELEFHSVILSFVTLSSLE